MMENRIYSAEIASASLNSDNPVHQRLLRGYIMAKEYVHGNLLEIGCGLGRGIDHLLPKVESITAIDKNMAAINQLSEKYPAIRFRELQIPPLTGIDDNAFDSIVSCHVIEHIHDDRLFMSEIHRVLKPGGIAILTTPNRSMSLTRNPWHIREYSLSELYRLGKESFTDVQMRGISGNDKVMEYYVKNAMAVRRLTRFDIFDLQHRLPRPMLRIPYEILNRWNRTNLKKRNEILVTDISCNDFEVVENGINYLDLALIVKK